MNRITLRTLCAALAGAFCLWASAADKITVVPTGRLLIDGAVFGGPEHEQFKPGAGITDASIGVKATFGKWTARLDVAYNYAKVGLRDIFIQYDFNERNLVSVGSFIQPYGLQSAYANSMKAAMIDPAPNEIFTAPRQLGIMYTHSAPRFWVAASAHTEPSSTILTPNQMTREGVGLLTRAVWRPIADESTVVQAGISGGFATPQYRSSDPTDRRNFTLGCDFPSRVDRVAAVKTDVNQSRNLIKFTPELLLIKDRLAFEGQYYFTQVNRHDGLAPFRAYGAYAQVRALVIGRAFSYARATAAIAKPGPRSLEATLNYSYSNLNSRQAEIFGGRLNQLSLTLSYYFNRYFLCRLSYSYSHSFGKPDPVSLQGVQLRLQANF